MAQLNPGDLIANDYKLEDELGRGGFGVVWRAHHMRLNREVAVKTIHGEALTRVPDIAARFTREVELAKRLEHPNVVRMYDYGELPDGSLFMVMEYIHGRELKEILVEEGPFGVKRATRIISQVLDALSEAHSLGIVHRDMKPANIMLTSKGLQKDRVKLLDFGIAKALDSLNTDQDLTGTGTSFGTPQYMAPEQIMGRDIGPFTDLYAVGLIFLELLSGQRAVNGNTAHEIAMKQVMEEITIPQNIATTALGPLIRRALAKDANVRYQSAAEMFADIEQAESAHVQAHTPMNPLNSPTTGQLSGYTSGSFAAASDTGGRPVPQNEEGATRVDMSSYDSPAVQSGPHSQPGSYSQSGPQSQPVGQSGPHSGPWSQSGPQSQPIGQSGPHSGPWGQSGPVPTQSGPQGMYPSHSGMSAVSGSYQEEPKSKLPIIIALALALLAVGAGAIFVLNSGSDDTTAEAADSPDESESGKTEGVASNGGAASDPGTVTEPTSRIPALEVDDEPAVDTAALEVEAAAEDVTLTIVSNVEAEVFRGGESLGTTPLELAEPASDTDVEFVLKADGHQDQKLTANFAFTREVSAELESEEKKERSRRSARKKRDREEERKEAKKAEPETVEEEDEEEEEKRSFRRVQKKKEKSGSVDVPTL